MVRSSVKLFCHKTKLETSNLIGVSSGAVEVNRKSDTLILAEGDWKRAIQDVERDL